MRTENQRQSTWPGTIVPALVAAVALAMVAQADVIHVPADYPTIQQAIDAASDGDEIIVAPGTYFENINLLGKAITLRSAEGPEKTIIDGQNIATVITCNSGEGPETVIQGLTVRNSLSTANGAAGMNNMGSSPTVIGCRFVAGVPSWDSGWGMNNEGGSPTIVDCEFSMIGDEASETQGMRNVNATVLVSGSRFAHNTNGGGGAGITSIESNVTVIGCVFHRNHGHGGNGAIIHRGGTLEVNDSVFTENSSDFGYGGGALWAGDNPPPTRMIIVNCTFESNYGGDGGPGAIGREVPNPSVSKFIAGSTFIGNRANAAGAIQLGDGDEIHDSIFIGNESTYASGAVSVVGSATILNSAFLSNVGAIYNGTPGEAVGALVEGHTLIGGSEFCGNDPGHVSGPWTDLGGNTFGPYCPVGDLNGDGVVNVNDLLILFDQWGECADTIPGNCPADLNGDGFVDVADLLVLFDNWGDDP